VRGLIIGAAVLCFAAALAIAGAGMRLPIAPPSRSVEAAPVEAPAAPPRPIPPTSPPPESPVPEPSAAASPQPQAGHLQTAVADIAREQAASRELVTELRTTVAHLQEQIARQSAAAPVNELQGRTVVVLGGDLFPPGQEALAPGVAKAVRSVLPELMNDTRQAVSVEGHSDSRPIRTPAGKPFKDNAELSLARARAVAALLKKDGVGAERIRLKGWGDTRPLVSNDTAEGRDLNRRVEIRLLAPSAGR